MNFPKLIQDKIDWYSWKAKINTCHNNIKGRYHIQRYLDIHEAFNSRDYGGSPSIFSLLDKIESNDITTKRHHDQLREEWFVIAVKR